jgi:2-polyprenyl-6-methoxyphenol hydroxylase-like FAD-dependent oxidoreductase
LPGCRRRHGRSWPPSVAESAHPRGRLTGDARLAPALRERDAELECWEEVKLLTVRTVRVERLRRWSRCGLLCLGDAGHAMSPAGGVGINLAIQDAVAAADLLGPTFCMGGPTTGDLASR